MASQDRIQLFNSLNHLTPQDLNKLIFALQPPAGVMPGDNAPRGDKVAALLNWAESTTGEGLAVIQEMLNNLDSLPPPGKTQKAIGPNPYKGLLAFEEGDSDRYFGRSEEIQTLWSLCRAMHRAEGKTRLLPIYGPSGSGKSSLAKAGLLAELRRRPLPGCDRLRIAAMVPGTQPLQALANTLARLADGQDALPVKKIREFTEELGIKTSSGDYDGLQRIASLLPDIATAPLILLVDQFEEIYSLCNDPEARNQFIANLLYAAQDRSQYVSVLLTCRSDFLAETQQYPELNKLFSTQGFLVPIMQPEGLAEAITEPAKLAGYEFDLATVKLLVEQCRGHQGALPLLQFALQRIWDNRKEGMEPAETIDKIGGVGGALAYEVQNTYNSLNDKEKDIAQRIFLALVQLDSESQDIRRRATKAELIVGSQDDFLVNKIIREFSGQKKWFLVTSFDDEKGEIIEVSHEALIHNWPQLREWISKYQDILKRIRKIERHAEEWVKAGKSHEYLLQGRTLKEALESSKDNGNSIINHSKSAIELIKKSQKQRQKDWLSRVATIFILPVLALTPLLFILAALLIGDWSLHQENCSRLPINDALLSFKLFFLDQDKKEIFGLKLCNNNLSGIDLSFSRVHSISASIFSNSNLTGANFKDSNLYQVDFQDATLREANFRRAILIESNMGDVDLTAANLSGAIFIYTPLEGATLNLAIMENTIFIDSSLQSSSIQKDQLENIRICRSQLPSKFKINPDRNCSDPEVQDWLKP